MNANKVSAVQSLDRAFQIIELLSEHPRGLALAEVCAATALAKGTASRLLSALITHGYVVQDIESRKYRLTMRLFEIGSRAANHGNLLSTARPYLEKLTNETGETVHLVSRVKDEVVYLYKEETGNSLVRMASCVGLHNPMYCTGVGKSILAFLPDSEIAEIWSRTEIIAYTKHTIVSLETLMQEIEQIRACGYATDMEEHELGVCCVAAPILDFNQKPIAAISLSAPSVRMTAKDIQTFAPKVLETAQQIAKAY